MLGDPFSKIKQTVDEAVRKAQSKPRPRKGSGLLGTFDVEQVNRDLSRQLGGPTDWELIHAAPSAKGVYKLVIEDSAGKPITIVADKPWTKAMAAKAHADYFSQVEGTATRRTMGPADPIPTIAQGVGGQRVTQSEYVSAEDPVVQKAMAQADARYGWAPNDPGREELKRRISIWATGRAVGDGRRQAQKGNVTLLDGFLQDYQGQMRQEHQQIMGDLVISEPLRALPGLNQIPGGVELVRDVIDIRGARDLQLAKAGVDPRAKPYDPNYKDVSEKEWLTAFGTVTAIETLLPFLGSKAVNVIEGIRARGVGKVNPKSIDQMLVKAIVDNGYDKPTAVKAVQDYRIQTGEYTGIPTGRRPKTDELELLGNQLKADRVQKALPAPAKALPAPVKPVEEPVAVAPKATTPKRAPKPAKVEVPEPAPKSTQKEPWEMTREEAESGARFYHGTTASGAIRREGFQARWTHLTDNKEIADSYQNWVRGDSPDTLLIDYQPINPAFFDAQGMKYTDHSANLGRKIFDAASKAEKAGHDALVIRNIRDHFDSSVPVSPHTSVIVFNPSKLKIVDHKTSVTRALSEGKRVPDNVVDEFLAGGGKLPENVHPEIKAKYAPEPAPKASQVAKAEPTEYDQFLERHNKARAEAESAAKLSAPVTPEGKIRETAQKFSALNQSERKTVREIADWQGATKSQFKTSLSYSLARNGDALAKKLGYSDWSEMMEGFHSLPDVLEGEPVKSRPHFGRIGGEKGEGKLGTMSDGSEWWTDTHQAYKTKPPKGFNAGPPVSPGGMDRVVPEFSDTVPASIVGHTKLSDNVIVRSVNDVNVLLDGRYVAMARAQFGDNIEFRTNPKRDAYTKPVLVAKNGERVGVIMPIQPSDAVKNFQPPAPKASEVARAELDQLGKQIKAERSKAAKGRTTKRGNASFLTPNEIKWAAKWVQVKGLETKEQIEEAVKFLVTKAGYTVKEARDLIAEYKRTQVTVDVPKRVEPTPKVVKTEQPKASAPTVPAKLETKKPDAPGTGINRADQLSRKEALNRTKGQSHKELEAQAKKDLDGGYDVESEFKRLAQSGRPATDREVAIAVEQSSRLRAEQAALNRKLSGKLSDEEKETALESLKQLDDRIASFNEAIGAVRSATGRSLSAYRIKQVYNWKEFKNLAEFKEAVNAQRVQRGLPELSDRQTKTIEAQIARVSELEKELESLRSKREASQYLRPRRRSGDTVEIIRARRKQNVEAFKKEFGQAITKATMSSGGGVFQSILESKELVRLAKDIAIDLVNELKIESFEVLAKLLGKELGVEVSEREARELITGKYDPPVVVKKAKTPAAEMQSKGRMIAGRESKIRANEKQLQTKISIAPTKKPRIDERIERLELQVQAGNRRVRAMVDERDLTKLQMAMKVLRAPQALAASIDISAPGRQGFILSLTNPKAATKAFSRQLKALASESYSEEAFQRILNSENAHLYKRSGLYIADPIGTLTLQEEAFLGNIFKWQKYNPVRASERAYVTYLNSIRTDVFDRMVKQLGPEPTDDQLKAIADYVNVASGRGAIRSMSAQGAANFANLFAFSARYQTSRVQYLLGTPTYRSNSAGARKLIVKEYAKFIAAMGGILGLAKGAGILGSDDPTSSDFLKLKIGEARIDLLAGMSQWMVFASRLGTGKHTRVSGETTDLRNPKYGGKSVGDVVEDFARSKANPQTGAAWDVIRGRDYKYQKPTMQSTASSFLPISVKELVEGLVEDGMGREDAIGLLNFLGFGVNTYDNKKDLDRKTTKG